MTTQPPDMTMHAGEGMNITTVASVVAACHDGGGFVHAILFTGNKITPTLDPNVAQSEGLYSAIWMLPKQQEKSNGRSYHFLLLSKQVTTPIPSAQNLCGFIELFCPDPILISKCRCRIPPAKSPLLPSTPIC